jgi:hypothetical protein
LVHLEIDQSNFQVFLMNKVKEIIFFHSNIPLSYKKSYFEENFKRDFHFFEFSEIENLSLHLQKKKISKWIEKHKKIVISLENYVSMKEIQNYFKENSKILHFHFSHKQLHWMNEFLAANSILKNEMPVLLKFKQNTEEILKEVHLKIHVPLQLHRKKSEFINKVWGIFIQNKGLFIDINLIMILENKKLKFENEETLKEFINEFHSKFKHQSRIIFFINEEEILKKFKMNSM